MSELVEVEGNEVTEDDRDPSNVIFRAGYLQALAYKLEGDDREYVLRASRSLRAYHESLTGKPM